MVQQSLRERNKQEKLARIQQAARQLFEEKGFEATTTYAVAELAQIGTGTLFLYVKDKQELVLLVYHQAIEETIEQAFVTLPADLTLLDELVYLFEQFFRLYNQNIELARVYIKELLFHEGYRAQASRQINYFLEQMATRIKEAQARGEVAQGVDISQATRNFFALYYAILTSWLSGAFSLEEAVNPHLRRAFASQINGLLPRS